MTIEFMALFAVTATLIVSIFAQQIAIDRKYGAKYAISNRDGLEDSVEIEQSLTVERLTRNVRNHVEGLAVFAPLVLISVYHDATNAFTVYASIVYATSRLLHFVFYAFGITPFRSFAWGVGFLGAIPFFIYGLITASLAV